MGFEALTQAFPWTSYSKKLQQRILNPRSIGVFDAQGAKERGLRLAVGESGTVEDGDVIRLYWLVDKDDGTIVDMKYQCFGKTPLMGSAESAAELCIGKNYDQASRVSEELIDKNLRDKSEEPAFPKEAAPFISLVVEALVKAKESCLDIPLPTNYSAPPVPTGPSMDASEYPGFMELSVKEKIAVIEQVLNADVRPYIALDAGGVEVINLLNDREVIISYQGTCTSCYSSVGTTLSYIQETLRRKIHPELLVIPDVDFTSPYPA